MSNHSQAYDNLKPLLQSSLDSPMIVHSTTELNLDKETLDMFRHRMLHETIRMNYLQDGGITEAEFNELTTWLDEGLAS